MSNMNSVTLIGRLTQDPELRFTAGGAAVTNFNIAVNRNYKDRNGEWQDKLDGFFKCTCWRDMAENVAESLTKGMSVIVVGDLKQRSWETQEGEKRSTIEIDIQDVGPSLRRATATVTKTPYADGGWSSQGQGQGQEQGQEQPAAPVARQNPGPDEAPF